MTVPKVVLIGGPPFVGKSAVEFGATVVAVEIGHSVEEVADLLRSGIGGGVN